MSSTFERVFPPTGELQLLDGGLNTKYPRAVIPNNESPAALNVIFTNGAAETRPGASYVNTTAVGTFACDGLYVRHVNTGAETMCAWFGGTMWTLGTTTFTTVPSAQSIFTAGVRVCAAEYENQIYFGNGGSTPYKYNGAEFTRHGIEVPSALVAATATTAGSLVGSFTFKVAYVNSGLVVGDMSAAETFVAASESINLQLPVAPASFGVNARRIYVASAATYALLQEVADNTTATFTVETMSPAGTAPSDVGTPPKYSQVLYHRDRLFVNDPSAPNYLRYSDLGNPYSFPSLNFSKIGDNTDDLVRGFAAQGESILVVCDKSEWLLYMPSTDDSDWKLLRVRSSYGSKSPYSFVAWKDQIAFPAVDNDKFVGFGSVSGGSLAPSTTFMTVSTAGSDLQSDRIEPDMFQVPESYLGNISGISYKNRLFFAVPYGAAATYNNRVYVYDFSIENLKNKRNPAWIPFTGWNAAQFCIYGGNLYYGSSDTAGKVYRCMIDSVYNDAGAAIDSYLWTKEFAGAARDKDYHKDFRGVDLYYQKAGDYYMDVGYRVDGDLGSGTNLQLDLNPGGSLWGTMRWGSDVWGGGEQDGFSSLSLGTARGKRIQFRFSNKNTANQKFRVAGFTFSYNNKGKR